jgi:hypothetical protein
MELGIENGNLSVPADVVSCALGDEVVLLALDSGVYFGLEGVGVRVWELLAGGADSARGIWSSLVSEYDVEPARCWDDVLRFLGEMRSRGLIRLEQARTNASTVSSQHA